MLRSVAVRAWRWWHDRRTGGRRDEVALELKPFSFWAGQTSALSGEGGSKPSLVPGYAFHTEYVPSTGGRLSYRILLPGLTGTRGQLLININGITEDGESVAPKVMAFPIDKLVAEGGEIEMSKLGAPGHSYAIMGTLTDDSDARADRIEISLTGGDSSDALRARYDAARQDFLSAPGKGPLKKLVVKRRATLAQPTSQMCTAAQMKEPVYADWCHRMANVPSRHRKQWEFVFILRTLEYHGMLRPGARGLGFGVGIEPLSSIFAANGCTVVATDLAADDDRAQVWNDTAQLGSNLRQIHNPHLCDEASFFERVSYRAVDMNAIPADLVDFDFTWSSCAYEHLGSIEAGLAFFENSVKCLKPGGIAVHTTELNLSSNSSTLEKGGTVIFRRRDFEELAMRLTAQGHEVMPITFDSGDSELDRFIDLPPYSSDPHLKLQLLRWVSTSFGLVARKKS
ncbi:SAM-dependent methyltransferase [Rhizorhabdus dicambivorans]|uniref:SAM-dependent methyltransferase n=1 Tax=Rhizorhabdus dicambivorans TaxID=1850238 RepID=UPI001EDD7DCB|nr:class I SAM-dependent methyltransferase [Rhizorhabdus dicambivorans]